MIGLDTNLLVRLIADIDDVDQTRRARELVLARCGPAEPGYVNAIVLCELAWVLRSVYEFGADDVLSALELLLTAESLDIEDRLLAVEAVELSRRYRVGFADAFIGVRNRARGCMTTATFDRRCLRLPQFTAP